MLFSPLPAAQTAVRAGPVPGLLLLTVLAGRPNPQVAPSASREEPRNPPSAVPTVKGSRVGALQARGDQDCETTPTITEVVSLTFGASTQP